MRNNDERFDNSQCIKGLKKKKILPTIHIQKPWIDTKIVNMGYSHGNNYTEYGLFYDNRHPDDMHDIDLNVENIYWKNGNHACFAELLNTLYEKDDKYNRMFYTIYLKEPGDKEQQFYGPGTSVLLSIEECIRWIQLSKEYKILPDYVDENSIEMFDTPIELGNGTYNKHRAVGKGIVILDLTKLTQGQLYLYLSTLRHLREDPGFVRTAIYLIDRCKMNFYAAYVFASRIAMSTTGHHTISVCRKYGEFIRKTGSESSHETKLSSIEALTTGIGWMISLQRFVKNPKKYDKHLVHQCTGFYCGPMISQISKIRTEINIYETLDPDIKKAIMAIKDTIAKKYINKFLEKKPRIKYKEASNGE